VGSLTTPPVRYLYFGSHSRDRSWRNEWTNHTRCAGFPALGIRVRVVGRLVISNLFWAEISTIIIGVSICLQMVSLHPN